MAICGLRLWWLGVALLLWTPNTQCRNLTTEDIRELLLSIVHMMRLSEDKLERHEFREKALGDQLKKMLMGLDKKHRALEPLKGMISRLDDRLSNVETILLQKEEREKSTQMKTNEALDGMKKTLESLTAPMVHKPNPISSADIENNLTINEDSILERRLEATDAKLDALKLEIENLKHSFSKDSLRSICMEMNYNVKPLEKHITEAEKLLSKYELKLNEYNNTACKVQPDIVPLNDVSLGDEAWHSKMTEVMEKQEKEIVKIQRLLSDAEGMWKDLPRLADLHRASNQTLQSVVTGIDNIRENNENSVTKITTKLREMGDRLVTTNEDIQRSLTQGNTLTERAYNDISRSYETLRTEVQTLTKSERVMLETADNVIATKKRVEYGVHQILLEIGEMIKIQNKNMNRTIIERLDNIETSILHNQTGSYGNLTTKLELEISQVWGQIGIMHQQLSASRGVLDSLSEQTGQYVNNSTVTMTKVKDEVGNITSQVVQLSDNMNYVLGRLSLATQEFSQISTGLTEVLSSLKADFQSVRNKIENSGPGPHNITDTF